MTSSRNHANAAPATPHAGHQAEAGAQLTIDVAAIVENWRLLAERAGGAECAAVVKADAYGLGAEPVSRALKAAGCKTFFVAQLPEARRLRAGDPTSTIQVLSGLLPGTCAAYAELRLRPTLGSLPELQEWAGFCRANGWRGGAALHVDTGMNRLGLRREDVAPLADNPLLADGAGNLVMSHLATADDPGHPLTARQLGLFRAVRQQFPLLRASLANSSGIFLGADATYDLVRPGIALYGGNPTPQHPNPMRSAVRLVARVLQVRDVPAGETVGYGATWTAQRRSRLAVVPVGYADGFLRAASASDRRREGAVATVAGRPCPLAGRISMDLLAIDVTDCEDGGPSRGDPVALLDEAIGIDHLAERAGTISYEILTSLGARYARVYA